jgi:radical SAM protein with 4Fe4S-binding SPASM domain
MVQQTMTLQDLIKKYTETYNIVDIVNLDDWYSFNAVERPTWLKNRLQSIYRPVYDQNERILFTLAHGDEYLTPDDPAGLILSTLQEGLNLIDISNFFAVVLTVNPTQTEIAREWIHKHNHDSIPIEFVYFDVDDLPVEKKITNTKSNAGYNYNSIIPLKITLDQLTEQQKTLLLENKSFCMYPWIHLYVGPDGGTFPCCNVTFNEGSLVGNVNNESLQDIWNGERMKSIRTRMLNDQPLTECSRCYEQEKSGFFSMRNSANKHHGHHIHRVEQTKPDGQLDEFSMIYWDIRFSNLCNLRCRSCGPSYSSSWYQDQLQLAPDYATHHKALIYAGKYETDLWEQVIAHIDHVEQIYFAGGEPLMMDEHYRILEELEKRKRFDVRLIYNTNFTQIKLKDRAVFDYWKKFDSVAVGASLDAMGPRAEYIRKGTDWDIVERNRQQMIEICPKVDFYISATLSILNAWHLPDFHKSWVDQGLIKAPDFNINILTNPSEYRLDIATPEFKQEIEAKYQSHLAWLSPLDKLRRASNGFQSAITFMNTTDNQSLIPKFWKKTNQLDQIRQENVLDIIPELKALKNESTSR